MNLLRMSRTISRVHDHKVRNSNNYCKLFLVIILVVLMIIHDIVQFAQNSGFQSMTNDGGTKKYSWMSIPLAEGSVLCFSMVCGFAPFVAKSCCHSYRYCCIQYQSW